ncbi:hypothetical protein PC9H_008186 [Pleurotus ostreatus]|uniref:Uncharacterized protein n=1 Tax=Pleurotus ostreatus TaxID=5322 RepID=A0A8H6ZUW7_PLEOS|nr:uncharacterized protein PC9H_008186 [Pleurotus ostreatus]KAF7428949.1 hypothetical protein PC9H_008186 [Pleurotus ostreatus]
MWDNRSTVDFIKSLFRVCGFVEPDLEEGVHWMRYSSTGRKTPPGILVAEPSGATTTVDEADSQVLGGEDEESDISEGGMMGIILPLLKKTPSPYLMTARSKHSRSKHCSMRTKQLKRKRRRPFQLGVSSLDRPLCDIR